MPSQAMIALPREGVTLPHESQAISEMSELNLPCVDAPLLSAAGADSEFADEPSVRAERRVGAFCSDTTFARLEDAADENAKHLIC